VITAAGGPGRSRVGIVASSAVGGAVTRNRAKRRIRAALARLALPEANDAIVIASREAVTAQFAELVKWLESAFRTGEEK